MSNLYDDMTPTLPLRDVWRGVFSRNVSDLSSKAYVTLPDMPESLEIGPCKWQARDAVSLPARGDDCLVIFDNDREPWVVAWWPF